MAASNEWDEWHLTPRGWVEGSTKTDFNFTEVSPPEDRVATYRYREYLASVYSKMDVSWERLWTGDPGQAQQLSDQHGQYPNSYVADRLH